MEREIIEIIKEIVEFETGHLTLTEYNNLLLELKKYVETQLVKMEACY